MFTKHLMSALALSSVLIIPSVTRAQAPTAGTIKVLTQTTPNYSVEINGANSRICVRGKCSYSYNCRTLSAPTLTQRILGLVFAKARVTCQTNQQPNPSRFSNRSPKTTTRIFQSQTSTSKGGVTQINRSETTVRSN